MKKLRRAAIGIILSLSLLNPIVGLGVEPTNDQLLGYKDDNKLLGVASAFSVFVEEDFGANGSDLEGRLFAGGSANIGAMEYYSTARSEYASVVIGNGTLSHFDVGERIFVFGTEATNLLQGKNLYQRDLINTEKVFSELRQTSSKLADMDNTGIIEVDNNWSQQINFKGTSNLINIFNLNLDLINSDSYYFNFEVPINSYVIVNINDTNPVIYTQLYGCSLGGNRISSNTDNLNSHILYNLSNAKTVEIRGAGTFYGTILAPSANGFDNIVEGAHCTGGVIMKSYLGGIEFGNQTYDGEQFDDDFEDSSLKEENSISEGSQSEDEASFDEDTSSEIVTNIESSIFEFESSDSETSSITNLIEDFQSSEEKISSFNIDNSTVINPTTGKLAESDIKFIYGISGIIIGAILVVLKKRKQ